MSQLDRERQEFKESLSGYTDYNLVSLMELHNVNQPTSLWKSLCRDGL